MKKFNKKGFTLAELLIVVAIVGVLVAISIPIFSGKLNKAKYATNQANIRAAKAAAVADYLTDGVSSDKNKAGAAPNYVTYYEIKNGTISNEGTVKEENGIYQVIEVSIDSTSNKVTTNPNEAAPQ